MNTKPNTNTDVSEYAWLRGLVGIIALCLPPALYFGEIYHGNRSGYNSLSEYYIGHERDIFVGALTAIGVILCSYRGRCATWFFRWKWLDPYRGWRIASEWTLSRAAGLAAIGVAMFPVTPDTWKTPVHYVCATVLFLALARFASLFADEARELNKPKFAVVLTTCSWVILLMIVAIAIDKLMWQLAILPMEWVLVWAFGVAWVVVTEKVETGLTFVGKRLGFIH